MPFSAYRSPTFKRNVFLPSKQILFLVGEYRFLGCDALWLL
jgi:hypothetical protein